MTTAGHTETLVQEIFQAVAEREMLRNFTTEEAAPQPEKADRPAPQWATFVTRQLARLPWHDTNLPDGRTPPQPEAAVGLIGLLTTVLEHDTISPSSVNATWAGGVAVEWHLRGIDLEISFESDGTAEFSFEDQAGQETEGEVTSNLTALRECVAKLPKSRP